MPDRLVRYVFRGDITDLRAKMVSGGQAVKGLADDMTKSGKDAEKFRRGLTATGDTAGKIGLVAAAGFGAMVVASANFDQAMSKVASTGDDARQSLDALREAAIDAGASTAFSATEAAAGIENLLKAGVSAQDVLGGGLSGALDLAAAGGLEVADAAEIAATALTQFKLSGEDVPRVADLLAAGAGKAQGDVSDLSMALKQSGLIASQMGVSIEETTGTLAAFASAGLLGSDAGTSFRTMLLRLANPTKESSDLMKSLGINAYDASGQFVGMASIAEQLKVAFEGKTQAERDSALATIFGSDAIRAAAVLYEQGGAGVDKWTANVNDAGYAAETAATRMDNLKGDLEELKGALETALIGGGSGSQGMFRGLTQGLTDAVNAFNDLPPAAQSTASALLGITAVTGGAAWFGSKVVTGIADTRAALEDLRASGTKTAGVLTTVGRAASIAAAGFGALVVIDSVQGGMRDASIGVEQMTKSLLDLQAASSLPDDLNGIADSIDRLANPNAAQSLQDNISDAIGGIGGGSELREARAQIEALDQALAKLVNNSGPDVAAAALDQLASSANLSKGELADLRGLLPGYEEAVTGAGNAATLSADATNDLAGSVAGVISPAQESAAAISDLVDAMRDQRDAAVAGFDAQTNWVRVLKEAREAAKGTSAGIRGNSEEALENRDTISSLAAAWNNQADAVKNNQARFREARAAFIETATAMGVPKRAAKELADQLLQIPESRVVDVTANTGQAQTALERILAQARSIPRTIRTDYIVNQINSANRPNAPLPGGSGESGRRSAGTLPRVSGLGDLSAGRMMQRGGFDTYTSRRARDTGAAGFFTEASDFKGILRELTAALDDAKNSVKEERAQRDQLIADKAAYAAEVGGSLSAASLFGNGLAGFDLAVAANTNDTNAGLAALQAAAANGLSGPLYDLLASSGDLTTQQQFAGLSAAQIEQREQQYASLGSSQAAFGNQAASVKFDEAIREQNKELREAQKERRELRQTVKQLEAKLDRLPDKVEDGARRGVADRDRVTGQRIAAGR